MGRPTVRDRQSSDGVLYFLDYTYKGVRHRPPLGHNLSQEDQNTKAHEAIQRIHAGTTSPVATITFSQFLPTYWQAFEARGSVDRKRPQAAIDAHLLPRYGDKPLASINTPQVGMDYITSRQRAGAAAGTIAREWNVLMRIINLAVTFDKLDRNRMCHVPRPEPAKRERIIERWELAALRDKGGDAHVWRAAVAAMHTGLRKSKLLLEAGDKERIKQEEDGYWAYLDKSKSKTKFNIEMVPLNRWAYEALIPGFRWVEKHRRDGTMTVHGVKMAIAAFDASWVAVCRRAGVKDLHFHDLRHLFATTLDELEVKDQYIAVLLGHTIEGSTTRYIRRNVRVLRDAVTRLEMSFRPDALSPKLSPKQVSYSTSVQAVV